MCESRDRRVPAGGLSPLSLLWQVLAGSQGRFILWSHYWKGQGSSSLGLSWHCHRWRALHRAWGERSQSWPCLSRFLVFPSSAFPSGPAYPLRDSIREMDAVETMLFPPFAGTWLWSVLVLLGLSTEPYHKGCASFHPALGKREKSIASWLQNFLLLFLAMLSSAAKHLAVFEWKTTKHRKTAEQSWQHTVRCSSGRFVEPLSGIKLEGCWDRRLTQSVVGKLLAIKKEP